VSNLTADLSDQASGQKWVMVMLMNPIDTEDAEDEKPTDDQDRWEPTTAQLRDGEQPDLNTHARRNLQQIRQGERARRDRGDE